MLGGLFMIWRDQLPELTREIPSRLIFLEAAPNSGRDRYVDRWLEAAKLTGAETWSLQCAFELGGVWAGVRDLLRSILAPLPPDEQCLLQRHASELTAVLPILRRRLVVENRNLTDLAIGVEKVRNYPRDRAYRVIHGLIEFLETLKARNPEPWIIACHRFSDAGELVRLFFRELMRRKGAALNLTLVLIDDLECSDLEGWQAATTLLVRPSIIPTIDPCRPPLATKEELSEFEGRVKTDILELEENLPDLIHLAKNSADPQRSLIWQAVALAQCNHHGFYNAALRYSKEVIPNLDYICSSINLERAGIVGAICDCFLALGMPEEALKLFEREQAEQTSSVDNQVSVLYMMALIHSRFMAKPDFPKAEEYIVRAQNLLEPSEIQKDKYYFLKVFVANGLAYIRHRQGRPIEAIALCTSGLALLQEGLTDDQHLLHRSVLLYNVGQVYFALREFGQAIHYYSAALEIDPNYSEYYNERGNIFLNLHKFDAAIADYENAIKLSPPYQEVWANLGQAYRLKEDYEKAIEAYSRALDLNPGKVLPLLGRAQSLESLGKNEEAVLDYTRALEIEPKRALVLGNRAALYHDLGRTQDALVDLDEAVRLAPENPALRRNRSVALASLGRYQEAVDDLQSCLDGAGGEESFAITREIEALSAKLVQFEAMA
jgi:tetratricopeptide (TPR) repeat protein